MYAKLLVELDHMTKRMVFDGYGVEQRHCDSLLESTNYMLRSFKYRLPQKDENDLGLHAHTDTSFFTILHQNNVNGLQVKFKNGDWIDIDPSPFMFLILAGDAFKVVTFFTTFYLFINMVQFRDDPILIQLTKNSRPTNY